MSNLKSLRKNYFVSFPIQGSILARCAGYWFFYNLFLWHVMFAYAVIGYQGELAFGGTPRTFWDLYADFTRQHYTMLVCSVAVLPVLLWDAMHMSHRIAGPLVRLKNDLNRLGRGEHVEPIRLRKEDLLQDVIGSFNALLEHRKGGNGINRFPGERVRDGRVRVPGSRDAGGTPRSAVRSGGTHRGTGSGAGKDSPADRIEVGLRP
jgi:hypothetical protein